MEKKQGFFEKLKKGLSKTGGGIFMGLFAGEERIDADFYDALEEAMIIADMGMETTQTLLERLRAAVSAQKLRTQSEAREVLAEILADCMRPEQAFLPKGEPAVLLIVGVNGVGKTTSIGKMAAYFKTEGRSPMMAAADTFRAAAAEQLEPIRQIELEQGLDTLPEGLQQAALLRIANPEASLAELAALSQPSVTKSCLSHRLKRLIAIAREGTSEE